MRNDPRRRSPSRRALQAAVTGEAGRGACGAGDGGGPRLHVWILAPRTLGPGAEPVQ